MNYGAPAVSTKILGPIEGNISRINSHLTIKRLVNFSSKYHFIFLNRFLIYAVISHGMLKQSPALTKNSLWPPFLYNENPCTRKDGLSTLLKWSQISILLSCVMESQRSQRIMLQEYQYLMCYIFQENMKIY